MKALVGGLLILCLVLQLRLWFGDGSIQEVSRLQKEASASQAEVIRLNARNQALAAEVADLKGGLDAIEERARAELGMISEGESFYQFVREEGSQRSQNSTSDPEVAEPSNPPILSEPEPLNE